MGGGSGSGSGERARDVVGKVALGVLVGGAVARLLGALYRRHHLLTSLPGPAARTLSATGHEAELTKVSGFGVLGVLFRGGDGWVWGLVQIIRGYVCMSMPPPPHRLNPDPTPKK